MHKCLRTSFFIENDDDKYRLKNGLCFETAEEASAASERMLRELNNS